MKPFQGCLLSKDEYRSALRAEHGTLRRFLAGCRCPLCDRPAHHRFAKRDALSSRTTTTKERA